MDDVGQRLSEAATRAEAARVERAVDAAAGPGVRALAEQLFPGEPERAEQIAGLLSEFGARVVTATLQDADLLRLLGPRRALVLDGRGGREVIANPAAPALDVDKVLEAGRRVVGMLDDLDEPIPGNLASAIMDLERAIGGRS